MTQYAVKKLTRSDMMFFEHHFRGQQAGNQKSIKLDATVFAEQMFPYVRRTIAVQPLQFLVTLAIHGPGQWRSPDHKTRMITAASKYQKYWHLNGETVRDPEDDPTRYHALAAGDLAAFAFEESRFQPVPVSIAMVLLSQAEHADAQVLCDLMVFLAGRRMALLPAETLAAICEASSALHPIQSVSASR